MRRAVGARVLWRSDSISRGGHAQPGSHARADDREQHTQESDRKHGVTDARDESERAHGYHVAKGSERRLVIGEKMLVEVSVGDVHVRAADLDERRSGDRHTAIRHHHGKVQAGTRQCHADGDARRRRVRAEVHREPRGDEHTTREHELVAIGVETGESGRCLQEYGADRETWAPEAWGCCLRRPGALVHDDRQAPMKTGAPAAAHTAMTPTAAATIERTEMDRRFMWASKGVADACTERADRRLIHGWPYNSRVTLVTPERAVDLVARALEGERDAWDQLVDDLSGLLWTVARANGLTEVDAADVVQTTWLRLAENLGRLRDPERVSSWLVTTARRESLKVLRGANRSVPVGIAVDGSTRAEDDPSGPLLRAEQGARLWGAFSSLPVLCRALLRVLMADPAPSYAEVSAALGMPIGSIGPRRARCLQHLRTVFEPAESDLGCER